MNAVVYWLLLVVLVLAPLPLGSNREWSWTLLAGVLGVLAVAWSLGALVRPRTVRTGLPPLLLLAFLAVCAWAAVQTVPGVPAEWQHPLWSLSGEIQAGAPGVPAAGTESVAGAADGPGAGSISLAPDDTWAASLRLVAYGLAFILAFQLCGDVRRARGLFRALVAVGLAGSLYGLFSYWGGQDRFLFFWELEHRSAVHGTFVNRNHFATWLGLCLLSLLALFYEALATKRRNPAYQLPTRQDVRLDAFLARAWPYLAMLIVMAGALILTHSRGGFLATAAGAVVLLLCLNHRQRIGSARSRAALAAGLLVSVAAFFITSEVLLQRLDQSTAGMEGRLQAFERTSEGVADNPVLGFGYGTFGDSFRLYRDEAIEGFFDKTHNTYLENIFELGWPAALLLFACIAWLALICFRGLRTRGRDWVYPATGLAATALVGTHALVDFSLQIPVTAVTYAALMGAAVSQSFSSRRD